MEPSNIPPVPRALREFLTERTGVEPELTLKRQKGKPLQIVLEHKNERVRLTVTYSFGSHRQTAAWGQTGSTLEIGGQPVNLAQDEEEYVRVFQGEAEPTGPGWESGAPVQAALPTNVGHNLVKYVLQNPSRSRRH